MSRFLWFTVYLVIHQNQNNQKIIKLTLTKTAGVHFMRHLNKKMKSQLQ